MATRARRESQLHALTLGRSSAGDCRREFAAVHAQVGKVVPTVIQFCPSSCWPSWPACWLPATRRPPGKSAARSRSIGSWSGTEQEAFMAMVRPLRAAERRDRPVHRHARPQRRAVGGRRQGPTARCRRPARPRPDGRVRSLRRAQGSDPRHRHRRLQAADRAHLHRPRHGRRQARRRLHQGHSQGAHLVQPEGLHGRRRRPPGRTYRSRPPIAPARARASWCTGLGSDGHLWLAGHRLDRGRRAARERPGRLRRLGCGPAALDFARDQERLPALRRGREQTRTAAPRRSSPPTSRDGGNGLFTDPPTVPVPPPGNVHDPVLQERRPVRATANTTSSPCRI